MKLLSFSLPIGLLLFIVTCANPLPIILAEDGYSDFQIVLPDEPTKVENQAAEELQSYLKEISTVQFPIVPETDCAPEKRIFIGDVSNLKNIVSHTDQLGDDGYIIKTNGQDLFLVGGKRKGTLFAVYSFLEDFLGCRKYNPTVMNIPAITKISINKIDIIQIPKIKYRETLMPSVFDSSYADWHKLHSRLDSRREWGMWVHTFDDLIPPQTYFEKHPEYFALINGERTPDTQLCLSNPQVLSLLVKNLRQEMADKPGAKYWSVSQNDRFGPCQCDSCLALEEKYGGPSGAILYFVNQVARQFPNKIISTLAYQYSRPAPKNILPEKNVNIMLCTIEMNRSQPIADDLREESVRFCRDIADWGKLTNNILLWDYIVQFRNYVDPFPNLRVLQPNLQFFVKNGVNMMFEQGSSLSISEFHELRTYIIAKLLWNPDANVEAIIDDFVNGFYGKAGKYIREYINTMHDALEKSGGDLVIYGSPYDGVNSYLTPKLIAGYNSLFNQAEAAVSDQPEILQRVRMARLPVEFAILEISKRSVTDQLSLFEKTGTTWRVKAEMKERLNKFVASCKKFGILRLEEHGTTPEEYKNTMEEFFTYGMVKHLALKKPIKMVTEFSPKYPVGGSSALSDGLRGTTDYHCNWLGFEGNEMDVIVDLQEQKKISRVSINFLQETSSWIWVPNEVEFLISYDGNQFNRVGIVQRKSSVKKTEKFKETFQISFAELQTRYVRVKTKSLLQCPNWHLGAGGKAWIFADEIVVN